MRTRHGQSKTRSGKSYASKHTVHKKTRHEKSHRKKKCVVKVKSHCRGKRGPNKS